MTRSVRRLGLTIALALVAGAAVPGAAIAHDTCAPASSAAPSASAFAGLLATPAARCDAKYAAARPMLVRDWTGLDEPADPFERQSAAPSMGNAPRGHAPCIDGKAAGLFPCDGVDLLGHVSHAELGTTFVNDIWGWTDPKTKKDYALVGSSTGTAFVDVSDAKRPQVLGFLPTASSRGGSSWRDIKVYRDHAFIVSEHTNHGVQVFDLTRLRDWQGTYTTYDADTRYTGHGNAHNIHINEATGYAYSVGAGRFSSKGQPNTVRVSEGSAAGDYLASGAAFGPAPTQTGFGGDLVVGRDGAGDTRACEALSGFPAGAIAVVDRGACSFVTKVGNAENAGAVGVIVVNSVPGDPITMGGGGNIGIPAVMVSLADGNRIKSGLPASARIFANDPPSPCGTGLHMIDVRDPKNPVYAGCEKQTGYVHDTQCVVYDGPDQEFQGREICFNSNGLQFSTNGQNFVSIVDVTDKDAPVVLSRMPYEGSGYSHQGWLSTDRRWFLHGDEGDEQLRGVTTTTRVWDVGDLRNPSVQQVFTNGGGSIDHNLYTQGKYAFASNYTTGLRVYDTTDLGGAGLREVGFFDMYPENDRATFEGGTWSNFPYFRQKGLVAVSSIDRGLFLLQPRGSRSGS